MQHHSVDQNNNRIQSKIPKRVKRETQDLALHGTATAGRRQQPGFCLT